MKKQTQVLSLGLLIAYIVTIMPLQAETGVKDKTSWQRWRKPVIATTMVVGGIAGWLLLDYYLNGQFNSKLNSTIKDLVRGNKGYSFFEDDGTLRKHPYISDAEFKDYQLYENARFDAMMEYSFKNGFNSIKNEVNRSLSYGKWVDFSYLLYIVRGFNFDLLAHQIGSKLCFLTSLFGGYWLMQSEKKVSEKSDSAPVAQS